VAGVGLIPLRPFAEHAGNQLFHIHLYGTLITAWNKRYYGFLCMRDLRAGSLKRLKYIILHSSSDQRVGKRPRLAHYNLKHTVPFFLQHDHLDTVLRVL